MKISERIFIITLVVIVCFFTLMCIVQIRGCEEHLEDSRSMRLGIKESWYVDNGYRKVYRGGWAGYVWEKVSDEELQEESQ